MPRILPTDTHPDHVQSVDLEGKVYRLRFRWRERTGLWYLSMATAEGRPLLRGRALRPATAPLHGHAETAGPPGELLVRGPDTYRQGDLGNRLQLVYYASDELEPALSSTSLVVR